MSEVPILIVLILGLLGLGGIWLAMQRGIIPGKGKVPSLAWGLAIVAVVYVIFGIIVPHSYQYGENPSPAPVPIPSTALGLYLVFAVVGVLTYVGTSEERFREFMGPIERFLSGEGIWEKGRGPMARKVVLVIVPVLVGLLVFQITYPKIATPTGLRIAHPTMPKKYEALENPYRHPTDQDLQKFTVEVKEGMWDAIIHPDYEAFAERLRDGGDVSDLIGPAYKRRIIYEGRDLYMINCRPCHGTKADGKGPMAGGFNRVPPADFTDEGTITTVTEAFALWRVEKGAPDLPAQGSPWGSAMPIWEPDLTRDQMWKIIMAEYDTAGVQPRTMEEH
ncbi:MAG: c-type cytochrome [Planctomycetota bacterium]|nr:c-type cytochrome [Planctomycetota bacterium]